MPDQRFVVGWAAGLVAAVVALLLVRTCGEDAPDALPDAPSAAPPFASQTTRDRPPRRARANAGDSAEDSVSVASAESAVTAAPVTGRVIDETGEPVAGAAVRLCVARDDDTEFLVDPMRTVSEARTDAAGRFSLDGLPSGTKARVEARALGLAAVGGVAVTAGGRDVACKLFALFDARMQFVDEFTEGAVADVEFQIRGEGMRWRETSPWSDPWPADADRQGLFRICSGGRAATFTVAARAPGYEPLTFTAESRRWGADEPPDRVRLRPRNGLWGELDLHVSAGDGPPVEGARVGCIVRGSDDEPFTLRARAVVNGSLGSVRVPAGRVIVFQLADNASGMMPPFEILRIRAAETEVPAGGRAALHLQADASARQSRVVVRMVDEAGRPLDDVHVQRERPGSSSFRLGGTMLPARQTFWFWPGKLTLRASRPGFEDAEREIEGRPGDRLEITIALRKSAH